MVVAMRAQPVQVALAADHAVLAVVTAVAVLAMAAAEAAVLAMAEVTAAAAAATVAVATAVAAAVAATAAVAAAVTAVAAAAVTAAAVVAAADTIVNQLAYTHSQLFNVQSSTLYHYETTTNYSSDSDTVCRCTTSPNIIRSLNQYRQCCSLRFDQHQRHSSISLHGRCLWRTGW